MVEAGEKVPPTASDRRLVVRQQGTRHERARAPWRHA